MAKEQKTEPTVEELKTQLVETQQTLKTKEDLIKKVSSNPQVLEVLRAQQENREIVISEKTEKKETKQASLKDQLRTSFKAEDTDQSSLEDLSKTQLVNVVLDAVADATEGAIAAAEERASKQFGGELAQLTENLTTTQKAVLFQARKTNVDSMRAKLPDYAKYEKDIDDVVVKHGLSFEDAYRLVKSKDVNAEANPYESDFERPSSVHVRDRDSRSTLRVQKAANRTIEKKEPSDGDRTNRGAHKVGTGGRAGFRGILQEGINKSIGRNRKQ